MDIDWGQAKILLAFLVWAALVGGVYEHWSDKISLWFYRRRT